MESLVGAQEVADYLNVDIRWVWRATRQGKIPCLRVGKYMRFDLAEVRRSFAPWKHDAPLPRSLSVVGQSSDRW